MSKLASKLSENKSKHVVLEGTVKWAAVHKKNEMSDKYQVDLFPTPKCLAALEELGVSIKDSKDGDGSYVTLKADLPPKVVDSKLNAIPASVSIGNGSKVKIQGAVYDWTFRGRKGTSVGLNSMQIIELVKYGSTNSLLTEEEGYTVTDDVQLPSNTSEDYSDDSFDE